MDEETLREACAKVADESKRLGLPGVPEALVRAAAEVAYQRGVESVQESRKMEPCLPCAAGGIAETLVPWCPKHGPQQRP